MAIRNLVRSASQRGFATPTAAPIRIDTTTNTPFYNGQGSGTTEIEIADISSVQALKAKTLSAADGVVKFQPVTGTKTWVSGNPYAAFTTSQATLLGCAGFVIWAIVAINATDLQIDTVVSTYSAVNKAGTTTATHTYVSGNEAKSVSTGTLTLTCTATDSGSGLATFNITPTSSITPTTLQLSFTIFPLVGAVTVL